MCTVKNSTVYQAKTTSMCTVNRSAWMHDIVSRLINFNEAAALQARHQQKNKFQQTTHNYSQYKDQTAAQMKFLAQVKKIKERTLQVMKQHKNAMKFAQLKKLTKAQ